MSAGPMARAPGREAAMALAVAAAATPLVALHAHRAAAPILAATAIVVMVLAGLRDGRWPWPGRGFLVLFATLAVWAGAGFAWSIDPAAGLDLLPRVAFILLAAGGLAAAARDLPEQSAEPVRRALVVGVAGAAVLLVAEAATGGAIKALLSAKEHPVMAIKAGSTILVLFAWPALATLLDRGRPAMAGLLAVALLVPLAFLEGRAALIAAAVGAVVFAAAWWLPRLVAAILSTVAAVGILSAPWIALRIIQPWFGGAAGEELLPFSGRHRIAIWRFAAEHILERPFSGWGFNVSRVFPGGKELIDVASGAMQMPLHPHNAALQWWLELGLPGALLGALVVAGLAVLAARRPTRPGRAAALALVAAGLTVSMLSYGAWQNWWLAALGLAAAFTALGTGGGRTHS